MRSALIGLIIARTLRGLMTRILRNPLQNGKCNFQVKLCIMQRRLFSGIIDVK